MAGEVKKKGNVSVGVADGECRYPWLKPQV